MVETSFSHVICNILEVEPFILYAMHNILELQASILDAICNIW